MIALLTILVHVLNIASAKARAKTVFGHLNSRYLIIEFKLHTLTKLEL